jgi:hypothetical protein
VTEPCARPCEKRGIGYSLGVPCSFRIRLPSGLTLRADAAVRFAAAGGWQVASCGPGSKGDRRCEWAWLATAGDRHFLLIRRSVRNRAELAFFYCWVPAGVPATLPVLTTVTGRRWTIEEDHQLGKDQFGYDHFQTRLHNPILRHLVLVMAALAVCAIRRPHPYRGAAHPDQPNRATTGRHRADPTAVTEIK